MSGNISEVYTVEGSDFSTIEILRALTRAKELAAKDKVKKSVYLNGNPFRIVDRKGNLVAA